jgi:hypothetical protein
MSRKWLGGSFAPPLSKEKVAEYQKAAESAEPRIREVMLKLCRMVEVFQETPESPLPGQPHPLGAMRTLDGRLVAPQIVPLEEVEIQRIWDEVPWDYEIEAYRTLFDSLPADSPLRTPCFHLLWFATELEKDREPLTNDKV